jgi:pantoate--beta-alanine ligase
VQIVTTIKSLRDEVRLWKQQGKTITLVPTMGNLHEGHLCLVSEAQVKADHVIVSIFVNPTQFGEGEDYSVYPRTVEADRQKLAAINTDMLFLPEVGEIYPPGVKTVVTVNDISDLLCGISRPGHFSGVATIVCKLLNMVQPAVDLFGEKDWQQLAVIRRMVSDLNMPVHIQGVATVRETDGLAMSSRNKYLTAEQRTVAVALYHSLGQARDAIIAGHAEFFDIEKRQLKQLQKIGFKPEYFTICRSDDLKIAKKNDKDLIILAAAKLGKARLIDNIRVIRECVLQP